MIARFLLLLLLSGTLFQMMSGVPHHCHRLVSFEDILVLFRLQRLSILFDHCTYVHGLTLLLLCWWPLKKCINVYRKVKFINHDCLPILMLLYIMLYICMLAYTYIYMIYIYIYICNIYYIYILAYLMLFAALSDAICLYRASFFAIDFGKCFLLSCFVFFY